MLGREILEDIETAAEDLLGPVAHRVSIRRLSQRLLGTRPQFAPLIGEGELSTVNGQWRIFVRKGTAPARARWVAAHEIAHWFWETQANYNGYDLEARCDALGAALVAPAPLVRKAVDAHGPDAHAIANALDTTQSIALLRLGEVFDHPVALLRRRRSTIIRGRFVTWPVPLSWQPAKNAAGLVKVAITDEPGRFGVKRNVWVGDEKLIG